MSDQRREPRQPRQRAPRPGRDPRDDRGEPRELRGDPRDLRGDPRGEREALRTVIVGAIELATSRGSDTVEAEHLLLALAAESNSPAATALAEVGFDFDALTAGIDAERERSLVAIGVTPPTGDFLVATPRVARAGWGASSREALRRGYTTGGGRGRRTTSAEFDLLAGILLAGVGTVPRIFAYAGVDRDALIGRVQRARVG